MEYLVEGTCAVEAEDVHSAVLAYVRTLLTPGRAVLFLVRERSGKEGVTAVVVGSPGDVEPWAPARHGIVRIVDADRSVVLEGTRGCP